MKINLTPIELIDQLRAWFHPKDRVITLSDDQWVSSKRVAWETAVSKNLALPGLVGFWPMSSVQRSTGNVYDVSGQGRTLTYNGNPVFSVYKDFVPYIQLDGTGDYLSRADETDLDVLGTETIYDSSVRGLTLGGWFWLNAFVGTLIGKHNATGNQRSYLVFDIGGGVIRAQISSDGINNFTVDSAAHNLNSWLFVVAKFVPSTSLSIFVNEVITINTTTIPAALFNSTAAFEIGRRNAAGTELACRASLCFLCANALPDDLILAKYYQERELFQ